MTEPAPATLEAWIRREYRHAAAQMLRSISAVEVVKERPGFGQAVRPIRGSVIASPVPASYDPDPDYFFHWYRDSAAVMDALRVLVADSPRSSGGVRGGRAREADADARDDAGFGGERFRRTAIGHFADFVAFSLGLRALDGRALVAAPAWRRGVRADFLRYLRADADLARAHGEEIAAETRVNPDGTLDISSWPRPQHDGPALRALAVLRWLKSGCLESQPAGAVQSTGELPRAGDPPAASKPPPMLEPLPAGRLPPGGDPPLAPQAPLVAAAMLVRADLAFTRARWREPCFDIWEEELGTHYYALCVAASALDEGASWLETLGDAAEARACRDDAESVRRRLDAYWMQDGGFYRSRVLASGERSAKELDISVVLAAIHADAPGPSHSVRDPRILATLARLESLFDAEYAINRRRPAARGPALGRYRGDVYYSGGAYYFSTLGAAELCFRAAAAGRSDGGTSAGPRVAERTGADHGSARTLIARGDAYLETVRAFTPASGDLSEQFDQRTGEQTSAKHLAWSYAAFITCIAARRDAICLASRSA